MVIRWATTIFVLLGLVGAVVLVTHSGAAILALEPKPPTVIP